MTSKKRRRGRTGRSRLLKVFRALTIFGAPALAWYAALPKLEYSRDERFGATWSPTAGHADSLAGLVVYVLGPLWLAITVGLVARAIRGKVGKDLPPDVTTLDRFDVLTASGSATLWASACAILAAARLGWASLSVLGVAGLAMVGLALVWTLIAAGGDDPMNLGGVVRSFRSSAPREGDAVTEELHLDGVRIPVGFRLFAMGKVGPRWPLSRYAVDAGASGGEVVLESDLGPAHRGRFEAPPMEVWLGDVLGLTRSVRRLTARATLTVSPRLRAVEGTRGLVGAGGVAAASTAAIKLPTEGSLRLREYQPGEDARRIHWMRSLSAGQVVVRLPDELPRDRPRVRLVLDTFLPAPEELTCDAHHELLDGMVKVWLGAARALASDGNEVTLVVAAPRGPGVAVRQLVVNPRAFTEAVKLGAEVRWQDDLGVEDLGLKRESAKGSRVETLVVSHRADPGVGVLEGARWIVVPRALWTHFDEPSFTSSYATLPYPAGSPDNRLSRRRADRARIDEAQQSKLTLMEVCGPPKPLARGMLARPVAQDRIRLEELS